MKKQMIWTSFGIAAALLLPDAGQSMSNGNGARPIASGSGMLANSGPNGESRQFSFQLKEMNDGSIQGGGNVVFSNNAGGLSYDANSYATDSSGNLWIVGQLTRYDGPDFGFVPVTALVGIHDGGRGPNGDAITRVNVIPAEDFDGNGILVPLRTMDDLIAYFGSFGFSPNADAFLEAFPPGVFESIDAGNVAIH